MEIDYEPDGNQHVILCKIKDYIASNKDGIESGERLELKSFYKGNTKLSIGMEGEAGVNIDETCFYFDDDPEEIEHYLGYLPRYEKPYWAGYCDYL